MSIRNQYPSIKPSLNLDFANTKTLDPRITFARASEGRFYDGKTFAKAEENLLSFSQEMGNGWWNKTHLSVTENTITAPDGTSTAESTAQTAGQTSAGFVGVSRVVGNMTYTQSIYAKANTKNFVILAENLEDANVRQTWFNLSNGTIGTTNGNHTANIVSVGNGWYRCSITYTIVSAFAGGINFYHADTNGSTTVTDSGGIYLWGAQLEQRSSVTAYTPTTTQPITNYIPVLQTAAANVARFDHNPITGESLGLLIEEQRTNLLLRSSEFDDAAWGKNNVAVTANAVVAPDGTLTGDKIVEDNTNTGHRLANASLITVTATSYTATVFAKAAERSILFIRSNLTSPDANNYFDLASGTVGTVASGYTATITFVGNGWYRCSITATAAGTLTNKYVAFGCSTANDTFSYTGDGFSGIYVWGAQLEAGAFPTSYIPTAASQVTRNADAASMTGVNFSSWYRQDEGTFLADVLDGAVTIGALGVLSASDGTDNNRIDIRRQNASSVWAVVTTNGIAQDSGMLTVSNNATVGGTWKAAIGYKRNDTGFAVNGGSVQVDTDLILQTPALLRVGALPTNANHLSGCIRKIAYYPSRLTDAQLQALTR